jgi:hypothetical protein
VVVVVVVVAFSELDYSVISITLLGSTSTVSVPVFSVRTAMLKTKASACEHTVYLQQTATL